MSIEPAYFLVINGKPQGPFSLDELKAMKIKPGDFIKAPGMNDYKEAHEMPELRGIFGFKKEALLVQYYASFDQRLLATAIDWFIIFGGLIFLAFIASPFIGDKDQRIAVIIGIMASAPIVRFIYNVLMECGVKQGTIGKQLVKITVCSTFGDRLSFGRSLLRNIGKIISTLPLFAGYLIAFFNKKQQALHDSIAGTMVIKDRLI
jgi:uncharacterized RDD family membrane protein YckC